MEKIKQFLKNKRNRAIGIAGLALVLAGVVAVCLLPLGRSTDTLAAATSSQPESSSAPASSETVSVPAISVPDIPAPLSGKPTVSSAPASEPALDLTVEAGSKAEPPASKPPASKPPASKPAPVEPTKPVQKPATDTSTSVPESVPEPAPSKPESLLPDPLPVEPEESPDGWKHGDTQVFDGETYYYHAGAKGFIDYPDWCMWGPYPQAKEIATPSGHKKFDGSFLKEGDESGDWESDKPVHWCTQEQAWISDFSWTNGYHDRIHPGWNK